MILGLSSGFHDAALTVLNRHGDIVFAGHSERYSKIKNDPNISLSMLGEIKNYNIDTIAYYENPIKKQLRRLRSGEGIQFNNLSVKKIIKAQLGQSFLNNTKKIVSYNHHLSHAAAGFQTSNFTRATVVVIDAIGEMDTISIYGAEYNHMGAAKYKLLWKQTYPNSIGLFYSAMTAKVNLKPMDEEYILMGMSAYGIQSEDFSDYLKNYFIENEWEITFKENLHIGVSKNFFPNMDPFIIARGTQELTENLICNVMRRAKDFNYSENLVYMGGVALNCLANRHLGDYFNKVWILPNPGDAGSSLGAAALAFGRKINFSNSFLGHDIKGKYPTNDILTHLLKTKIVGVASGKAEFGPRALGNRSLLADPRDKDIKEKVNSIKRRQQFRPFAPVILEEMVESFFEMPKGWKTSPYMQTVAKCKYPDKFPAICHVDGTSRVQTVPNDNSGIRELLEKWYVLTECPMLLNTSLNIRGEPMVNDRSDADRFENLYQVKVCS
jgi:carbamoyltransferase